MRVPFPCLQASYKKYFFRVSCCPAHHLSAKEKNRNNNANFCESSFGKGHPHKKKVKPAATHPSGTWAHGRTFWYNMRNCTQVARLGSLSQVPQSTLRSARSARRVCNCSTNDRHEVAKRQLTEQTQHARVCHRRPPVVLPGFCATAALQLLGTPRLRKSTCQSV